MRFTGQGPQGFPGQQGPGGMAPQMNPMQKQGVQMPQAPQMPQPMPKPGGVAGGPSLQNVQAGVDARYGGVGDLGQARQALERARTMGADPMTLLQLENNVAELEARMQGRMMRDQQRFNDMTAGNSAPGVGRGAPNNYSPGYQSAARNQNLEQQLIAAILGGGGGPGVNRR